MGGEKLGVVGRGVLAVACAGILLGHTVFAAQPFTQLPGLAACVSATGSDGDCATGIRIEGVTGAAVSPDGRSVYVTATGVVGVGGDAIATFDREPVTGALTQKASPASAPLIRLMTTTP